MVIKRSKEEIRNQINFMIKNYYEPSRCVLELSEKEALERLWGVFDDFDDWLEKKGDFNG